MYSVQVGVKRLIEFENDQNTAKNIQAVGVEDAWLFTDVSSLAAELSSEVEAEGERATRVPSPVYAFNKLSHIVFQCYKVKSQ